MVGGRHAGWSLCFLTQHLFNPAIRDITNNADALILFGNKRSNQDVLSLEKQMFPRQPGTLTDIFQGEPGCLPPSPLFKMFFRRYPPALLTPLP